MFEPLHHTSEYGNRVDLSRWPSVLGPYFAALAATRPPQVKLVH